MNLWILQKGSILWFQFITFRMRSRSAIAYIGQDSSWALNHRFTGMQRTWLLQILSRLWTVLPCDNSNLIRLLALCLFRLRRTIHFQFFFFFSPKTTTPHKLRKKWMHRVLDSLREPSANASTSSSQGSIHSLFVQLSESPGSSTSLGSPTVAPSNLTKELGLGITYSSGYECGAFLYLSSQMFSFNLFSCVDRLQREGVRQENHERHRLVDNALSNPRHQHPLSVPLPMPAYLDTATVCRQFRILPSTSLLTSPFANLPFPSPALLRSTSPPLLWLLLLAPLGSQA